MPLREGYVYLADGKLSPLYMATMITLSLATLTVIIYLLVHYVARGVSSFSQQRPLYRRKLGDENI